MQPSQGGQRLPDPLLRMMGADLQPPLIRSLAIQIISHNNNNGGRSVGEERGGEETKRERDLYRQS